MESLLFLSSDKSRHTLDRLRCDECGRFVSYSDIDNGLAVHALTSFDTQFSSEQYETLCRVHNDIPGQGRQHTEN